MEMNQVKPESKKVAASGKLSKEDVEWLQGPTFNESKPNPHVTPGLAESMAQCRKEYPMTWEEAHRASVGLREISTRHR